MRIRHCGPNHPYRSGTIYLMVMGVGMILSLIGMTAMHLARLELRATTDQEDAAYARVLAQSSIEMALTLIQKHEAEDTDWRDLYKNEVVVEVTPNYDFVPLYFKMTDTDGAIDNNQTDPVQIHGIGRFGNATSIYRVTYAPSITADEQVGPFDLRTLTATPAGASASGGTLSDSQWYGQYILPNLPAEAVSWSVTQVSVKMKHSGSLNASIDFGLRLPNGSSMPGTVVETVTVNEGDLPSSSNEWHAVPFNGITRLDPSVGLCVTLETSDADAASLDYVSGGVSEPNAHMLTGNQSNGWTSAENDKSIFYRVRGTYATSSGSTGEFSVTPGSWRPMTAD